MLEHNGRQGSKEVDISYSPPPLVPPALQLTSWQPWGLWLVMAYCLDPINAWPPLCPQRTHINKSNPVSGRVFYCRELASNMGRQTKGWLQRGPAESCSTYLWGWVTLKLKNQDPNMWVQVLFILPGGISCSKKSCRKSAKQGPNNWKNTGGNGYFPLPNSVVLNLFKSRLPRTERRPIQIPRSSLV